MGEPRTIRIAFARSVDAAGPAARLAVEGLETEVDRLRSTVAVAIRADGRAATLAAVTGALDGWLADTSLPFAAQRTGPAELVVRPPAD